MAPILPLSVTDCLSLARVSRFGRWGTWKDKWCEDGSEVEEEEEERSAREESSSEGESSEGESSSESRALRLWKRNATKHCREVAMVDAIRVSRHRVMYGVICMPMITHS